jgi:hypothetical protein
MNELINPVVFMLFLLFLILLLKKITKKHEIEKKSKVLTKKTIEDVFYSVLEFTRVILFMPLIVLIFKIISIIFEL